MTRSSAGRLFIAGAVVGLAVLQARAEEQGERSFTVHPIGHVQKSDGEH